MSTTTNTTSRVTFTQVCSFICTILLATLTISCKKEVVSAPAKVVKTDLVWKEVPLPEGIKIHSILKDGQVLLTGDAWQGRPMSSYDLHGVTGPGPVTLLLEGNGSVGDPVILVRYIEKQELSNGEVRTLVRRHFGIKSTCFKADKG
jgi:hypothetical protein